MTKLVNHIDDGTLAVLKKIDEHGEVLEAVVRISGCTFRLDFDATKRQRWIIDITNLIRAEVVA